MPYSTELCSTCRRFLCPEIEVEPFSWIKATGQTFEVFREAVEQGCAICSKIWNADDQYAKAWPQISFEAWKPVEFSFQKDESEAGIEDIIDIIVMYRNPITKSPYEWLSFCLVSSNNSKYEAYFERPQIEPSTSPITTLTAAYGWFVNCCSSHLRCSKPATWTSDWLPTRLIDIGHQESTEWRLCITSEDGISPQSAPYITLSYRWAPNPSLILLTSNIIEFRGGKPIKTLPQLFQDVIVVAQRFSIRYIWIDALCIVQDSREDWEAQASTMRMVYANSACNIAASGSNSPDEGLFRACNPKEIQPSVVQCSLFSSENRPHYIFERNYWDREILAGPLHKRGWVFQERLLAPRVLYFGKNQVLWECLTEHKCEGFPSGIPGHISDKYMDPLLESLSRTSLNQPQKLDVSIFSLWLNIVEKYSQCALTNPSDKLFAIAGIAQLFRDATGDEYVAGLWKSRLIEMLDWRVEKPKALQSSEYRAPSWSWASVDGPVLPLMPYLSDTFTVELLDVHVQARTPNIMADVSEASITVRAKTFMAICHYLENGRRVLLTEGCQISSLHYLDNLDIKLPEGKKIVCMLCKEQDRTTEVGSRYRCIVCLILEELPCPSSSQAQYRRLGTFMEEKWENIDIFNTRSEIKVIKIV
ncbi:heterokaryon incompatibility protein-domain-containing protein [Xylaria castorea]|nr:heterokaryon incompatibility protein-domain-containing protein [Xylaria castorea]